MRNLRYTAAAFATLVAGWALLAFNGVQIALQDRAQGWFINDVPSHPGLLSLASLGLFGASVFVSAWLIGPRKSLATDGVKEVSAARHYFVRLGLSVAGALISAFLIALVTLIILDS